MADGWNGRGKKRRNGDGELKRGEKEEPGAAAGRASEGRRGRVRATPTGSLARTCQALGGAAAWLAAGRPKALAPGSQQSRPLDALKKSGTGGGKEGGEGPGQRADQPVDTGHTHTPTPTGPGTAEVTSGTCIWAASGRGWCGCICSAVQPCTQSGTVPAGRLSAFPLGVRSSAVHSGERQEAA